MEGKRGTVTDLGTLLSEIADNRKQRSTKYDSGVGGCGGDGSTPHENVQLITCGHSETVSREKKQGPTARYTKVLNVSTTANKPTAHPLGVRRNVLGGVYVGCGAVIRSLMGGVVGRVAAGRWVVGVVRMAWQMDAI